MSPVPPAPVVDNIKTSTQIGATFGWSEFLHNLESTTEDSLVSDDSEQVIESIATLRQFVVASILNKDGISKSTLICPRLIQLLEKFEYWSTVQPRVCIELCGLCNTLSRDSDQFKHVVLTHPSCLHPLLQVTANRNTDVFIRESSFLFLRSLFTADDVNSVLLCEKSPFNESDLQVLFSDQILTGFVDQLLVDSSSTDDDDGCLTSMANCYLLQLLSTLATNFKFASRLYCMGALVRAHHTIVAFSSSTGLSVKPGGRRKKQPSIPVLQKAVRFALKLIVFLLFHVDDSFIAFKQLFDSQDDHRPILLLAVYSDLVGGGGGGKRKTPVSGSKRPSRPGSTSYPTEALIGLVRGLLFWRLTSTSGGIEAVDNIGARLLASSHGINVSDNELAFLIIRPLTEAYLHIDSNRFLAWICHVLSLVIDKAPGLALWTLYANSFLRQIDCRLCTLINSVLPSIPSPSSSCSAPAPTVKPTISNDKLIQRLIPLLKLLATIGATGDMCRVLDALILDGLGRVHRYRTHLQVSSIRPDILVQFNFMTRTRVNSTLKAPISLSGTVSGINSYDANGNWTFVGNIKHNVLTAWGRHSPVEACRQMDVDEISECNMCVKLIDFALHPTSSAKATTATNKSQTTIGKALLLEFQNSFMLFLHSMSRSLPIHHALLVEKERLLDFTLDLLNKHMKLAFDPPVASSSKESQADQYMLATSSVKLVQSTSALLVNLVLPHSPGRKTHQLACFNAFLHLLTKVTANGSSNQHPIAQCRLNAVWGLANLLIYTDPPTASDKHPDQQQSPLPCHRLLTNDDDCLATWRAIIDSATAAPRSLTTEHNCYDHRKSVATSSVESTSPFKSRLTRNLSEDDKSIISKRPIVRRNIARAKRRLSDSSLDELLPRHCVDRNDNQSTSIHLLTVFQTLTLLRNLFRHQRLVDLLVKEQWRDILHLTASILNCDYPGPVKEQALLVLAGLANTDRGRRELRGEEELINRMVLCLRSPSSFVKAAALTALYNLLDLCSEDQSPEDLFDRTMEPFLSHRKRLRRRCVSSLRHGSPPADHEQPSSRQPRRNRHSLSAPNHLGRNLDLSVSSSDDQHQHSTHSLGETLSTSSSSCPSSSDLDQPVASSSASDSQNLALMLSSAPLASQDDVSLFSDSVPEAVAPVPLPAPPPQAATIDTSVLSIETQQQTSSSVVVVEGKEDGVEIMSQHKAKTPRLPRSGATSAAAGKTRPHLSRIDPPSLLFHHQLKTDRVLSNTWLWLALRSKHRQQQPDITSNQQQSMGQESINNTSRASNPGLDYNTPPPPSTTTSPHLLLYMFRNLTSFSSNRSSSGRIVRRSTPPPSGHHYRAAATGQSRSFSSRRHHAARRHHRRLLTRRNPEPLSSSTTGPASTTTSSAEDERLRSTSTRPGADDDPSSDPRHNA